ncbi:hypothetical protein HMPREF9371_0030 [Neisseria shayeganii 871]|uniref:Uncharacterized protein n=1 Tax=Neisseria shayeganii 871 TaxID=1032488 RepID=G4CEJ1_9NEIS|nr:hypothetical protein HMPREF9371_0030 [Neisseria shayeganii 871]
MWKNGADYRIICPLRTIRRPGQTAENGGIRLPENIPGIATASRKKRPQRHGNRCGHCAN